MAVVIGRIRSKAGRAAAAWLSTAACAVLSLPLLAQGVSPASAATQTGSQSITPSSTAVPGSPVPTTPQASQLPGSQTGTPPLPGAATSQAQVTSQLADLRPGLTESVWKQAGRRVTDIRFDGVIFDKDDLLLAQLTQKSNAPLNPDHVRADLRRLFASGRYRDISVRSEAGENGGIVLVYAGVARYYVGRVQIVGVSSERLASLLEFATRLEPGTPYSETQVPAAIDGLKEALARNGYYQPKIDVATTKDDSGAQVNFTFTVVTSIQAHIGNIDIEGTDVGFTQDDFRKKGQMNCGLLARTLHHDCRPKVTRDTTSNALTGLRKSYQKMDRLEATVSVQKQTYNKKREQLDYGFAANQGPKVLVEVIGAKISKSRLHLIVPVYEESAVDNDLLNEGAHNIRDLMQQQGYFDATVAVKQLGEGTDKVTVQFTVDKGVKHKVTDVVVTGNKYFDNDTILERLSVKKGDLYQRSGKYSAALVRTDTDSIESLYRANGFNKAKVIAKTKDIEKSENGHDLKVAEINVTYVIEEGPQQKFGPIKIEGVDPSRRVTIGDLLQSEEDQPFSLLTLSGDRDTILSWYVSHGFDQARVELKQDIEGKDAQATDVTFTVDEGQQVFIDKVLLSGIQHVKPGLVEGQMRVHAGDPLDQSALLDTQRNLYNLALFNEVNAAVQNPTGDAPRKNVLVQLTEARRWDVTYGFGFEAQTGTPSRVPGTIRQGNTAAQNGKAGVSPRVSADVSRINLFGTDKSLTLHTTYGLLETVASLTFTNPRLLNNPNLTASVSAGYSNVQNITTFSSKILQGDFRVSQKIRKADTMIYDFQYRRVEVDPNSLEIATNLIPLLSQPVRVSGPGFTFFHDTRSPSPLDATHGHYYSVQEFIATSKFGGETDFNRVDFSYSSYYQFGKKKYVFARNTRIGVESNYGANPNIGVSNCAGALLETNGTCNPIPLAERLYAGGATSHRGFPINGAGPRDLTTGYPVGGSAVVVNTFELRLPPPTLPFVGDSVSFVIFHDMGNVFQHPGDMFKSIKNFKQPNQSSCSNVTTPPLPPNTDPATYYSSFTGTCSFNYYSHAVGLGARYKTPVGPIRVDFSFNLNPPKYPVFYDYTQPKPYVGQASHFNFFFSIGQSF